MLHVQQQVLRITSSMLKVAISYHMIQVDVIPHLQPTQQDLLSTHLMYHLFPVMIIFQ